MSNTRRRNNKYNTEESRASRPYKRQRKSAILNEFEMSYIEINRSPQISL